MKISVIVPVYNVEDYLDQCLTSIIGQTYNDLEIILVNDGSTDTSPAICDEYAAKDSRIKVIHQQNGGVSSARNTGIYAATGDYITFVDSDDWLDKDIYQFMAQAIQTNPNVDLVMCDFVTVTDDNEIKVSSPLPAGLYSKKDIVHDIYPTLLVTENFGRLPIISACTCLFKNALFVDHGIHFDVSLRYSEDYLFMAEVMTKSESYYYLKDCYGYSYRQYQESRSKKYQPEWWVTLKLLNEKLKNTLSSCEDYDFTRQLKLQLIHSVLFVTNSIVDNPVIPEEQKAVLLKELFNDKNVQGAFSNLNFDQQPIALQISLYLIKRRMYRSYLVYRNIVAKLKYKFRSL